MRRVAFVIASAAIAVSAPALAKECRMPEPPSGMALRRTVDCEVPLRGGRPSGVDERGTGNGSGFIALGPGTQVRISGRIRSEVIRKP